MERLLFLSPLRWYLRWPVKAALFALTVLLVCFPSLSLLSAHIRHWQDPNALIEPDAEALQPLVEQLKSRMTDDLSGPDALKVVQAFVYEKLPYEWDWNTWGTVDYLPTVTEAIEMGKEDCDGQAVLAASLLENFGFETQLVTDFTHMWVKTDQGETMSPRANKALVATDEGIIVLSAAFTEFPQALGFGLSVFPLERELIIAVVLWYLLLRRGGGNWAAAGALAFVLNGLLFLRIGGASVDDPMLWAQLVGLGNWVAAAAVLFVVAPRNAAERHLRRVETADHGSPAVPEV